MQLQSLIHNKAACCDLTASGPHLGVLQVPLLYVMLELALEAAVPGLEESEGERRLRVL